MINTNRIMRTGLLLAVTFLMHCAAKAQVMATFTPRFSDAVYGDYLTIGNNMLSTTATGNYTGSDGNHNLTTVFVDIDADGTTFNSSSANLTGPIAGTNCIAIKKAYLYWAAADLEGGTEPVWNYNQAKLMLPGSSSYTTITADNVIFCGRCQPNHFVNDPYVCFKDITSLVQGLGNPFGKYQMANVKAKVGTLNPDHTGGNVGTSGGWQIIFIYEGTEVDGNGSSVLPNKYISVFDGYANVTSSNNNFNIPISGFQTPPVGTIQTRIMFGSLEGDRDLTGDEFQIRNPSNVFVNMTTGSLRPTNNFFSSRITVNNTDFTDRNPASTNTTGYDIGHFILNNSPTIITNSQTSAVFRLTSNQETYGLYMVGFSTDVWAPDLSPLLQTSTPGTVNPGDTISYCFTVKNNGNDNAVNVAITRTLPPEVDLVQPITPLPGGVTYSYNVGTRVLTFNIQNGLVDTSDAPIIICYKTVVKPQCYFLETACVPSTTAQLLATYTGAQNPATQTTLSSNGVTGCGLGNDKANTTLINQPSAAIWAILDGALDRTVNCDDAQALAAAQALFPATNKCSFILNKISGSFAPNTCPIKGKYTNTWTFTDKCGRTSPVFTQVITVQDTTKPVISGTPQNITVSCASDVPQASITSVSATDNCAGTVTKTVADVITNQTCANKFIVTRTWTATDVCGNSSTSSQTITVNDQTPPVITGTPQNITVSCASDVPQASTASVSATDNCAGTVTKTVNDVITNQTCANKFIVTRTWTATDVCGNSSTSSQTITVNDQTPPAITGTPQNITISCASDVPQASIGSVSATDNCAGTVTVTVNDVVTPGSCANKFIVTRTWTATDVCGNSSTASQTITVNDQTPPVITGTPQNITISCASDVPQASIGNVSATDNCAGTVTVTVNDVVTPGSCANKFIVTRTWTATDVCGNSSTSSQTITVNDTIKPAITGTPQDITVSCASDVPQVSTASVSATDNCTGTVTVTVADVISNQTCANKYTITRTWTATDVCGNSSTSSQTITVNDTIKPLITGTPQNITVSCTSDVPQASTASVSATDNCAGTVTKSVNDVTTSGSCANKFIVTRTWTATDVCGNSSTSSQTITVNDTIKPAITGTPQNVTVSCASDVPQASTASVSATDNCAGQVTVTVNDVTTPGSCANKFIVTRTWTATDVCGNSSTSSQTITVNDTIKPVFVETLPRDITVDCNAIPTAAVLTATDNCGQATVTYDESTTPGGCTSSGGITRTWTATDVCNNTTVHIQTITVQDTTKPVITGTPQDTIVNCASDVPRASTTSVSTTDNCTGTVTVTVADVITNQTCANKFIVARTWTATDVCGNSSTSSQTITVNDTIKPVITGTPQNIKVSCASDVPQASTTSVSATDNCAGQVTVTVNDVVTPGSCANKFIVARTWTATDVCGNSSTSSQTITVNDTIKPVITGTPQNITVSCASDVPQASITSVSATDNCAGQVTVTVNDVVTPGSCANKFIVTRTWIAIDECGNSSTSSQTITVNDTIKPVITDTPQNITVSCASDVPQASTASVSTTDNCAGTVTKTVDDVVTQGSCANKFTVTRTWTATDVCGNSSTSSQTITVNDTIKPVITGTPQTITVSCASDVPQASTASVSATDNCAGQVTVTVNDVTTPGSCANKFIVTRTWTATDVCGNSSTSSQTITVNDTIKPIITGTPLNITVSCASDVPQASTASVSATDNCAGQVTVTVNDVTTPGSCANKFTVTRTWTATDVCGNSSTSSQTITVNDTIKPLFVETLPRDITVDCNAIPTAAILTATDNCGQAPVTYSESTTQGGCTGFGGIIRTWTATDACNNITMHIQTITVQDTTKPVITGTPQDITVSCASDVPQASTASVSATDNCTGTVTKTVADVITNQSCANKYTVTRTWTATDACGNSSTSSQTITVNDTIKPVITGTPQNITVSCASDVPQASTASVSATDNCAGTVTKTIDDIVTPGSCANKYTVTRTWTATDVCGNSSTSSQTITVNDTIKPVITGTPQNITVSCASDVPQGSTTSISVTDNCGGTVTITVNDVITNQSCANKYTVTRTWTATDVCGNSSTSSQTITVNDQTPPVITGTPQNITVSCASDVPQASITSVSATDNCAGTVTVTVADVITNQTCANRYTVTRTWTATDVCGNSSTSSQTITVNNQTPPVITGTPQNITVSCASDVPQASNTSVSATDNCAGTVTVTVADVITNQTCANRYTVTRTWTATDVCGSSSTSSQTITVNDTIKPLITGTPQNITVSCASDVPQASTTSVSATDNCTGTVTKTVNDVITNQTCANKFIVTRTWTATDVCGNSSTSSQTITVNDQTPPVITGTPQNITVSCASDVPQASIASVSVTDNCAGTATVTLNDVITNQSCANKYTVTRTWTATDVCGNSSTSSQTITVNDQTPPVITGTPQNITISCASDVPQASIGSVSATDNCAGTVTKTVNDVITNQTCANKFIVTRTWTATDVCGNSSTSSQTIMVNDTIKPIFVGALPEDQIVCEDVPNAAILTVIDNCGSASVVFTESIDSVTIPGVKIYTRIWTASDLCENSKIHTQTISVNSIIRETISREICEGELVTLGNNAYGLTGTYSAVFESANGCDSVVTLILTVNPTKRTNIDAIICQGEQVQIGGQVYTASVTNEIITLHTSRDCDSIITLNLLVLNSDTIITNRKICSGDRVDIGGHIFTATGTYYIPFQNSQCTGIVQLNLIVLEPTSITINQIICEGEVVTVGGQVFSTNGTHTISIPNAQGCDSLITLNLIVKQKTNSIINSVICYGESVLVGTQVFNTSGTYQITLTSTTGCDSNVVLNLQVLENNDTTRISRTICDGESVTVNGQVFNEDGTYYIHVSNERCSAVVELNLNVNPVSNITLDRFICEGEAIVVGNQTFTKDGTYIVVLPNSTGCDSTITLNLNVSNGGSKTQTDTTICFGESVMLGGQTFSTTGLYQVIFPAGVCRDTLLINLLVNPVSASTIDTTVFDCHGGVTVGGQVFIEPGTYHVSLQNSFGCDSLITLNLRIRICDTIPIGQDTTIYDTLPVLTTLEICNLSLPPGNNVIVKSCDGETTGTEVHGTWTIDNQTKCLVFTALPIVGNDTLCITACDTFTRQCNTTTVIITVTGLPPIANDDCVEEVEKNQEIIITVLENDVDPDQDQLILQSIIIPPKNGIATIDQRNQNIVYTPNNNFCGRDTLYYVVCDGDDGCDTAMVCLKVKCQCDFPQVITPNNDGFNDNLVFPCLNGREGARLLVWHRWGLIVYEDDNYKNDWNGTLKGELLPAGTYWYSIEYKDAETGEEVKEVNYFMIIN